MLERQVFFLSLVRAVRLVSSEGLLLSKEVIVTGEYGPCGVEDILDVEGMSLWCVVLLGNELLS